MEEQTSPSQEVTQLLRKMRAGDPDAPARVIPFVYDELRRLARGYLQRERANHTLQPTAVVQEAYLRLIQEKDVDWESRSHFFAIAARLMREILVNYAKARQTAKRGSGVPNLMLEEAEFVPQKSVDDLVALDELLKSLARQYPRQSNVVEFRFFGGMETSEIASALAISEKTVLRDWQFAKLWLARELTRERSHAA